MIDSDKSGVIFSKNPLNNLEFLQGPTIALSNLFHLIYYASSVFLIILCASHESGNIVDILVFPCATTSAMYISLLLENILFFRKLILRINLNSVDSFVKERLICFVFFPN